MLSPNLTFIRFSEQLFTTYWPVFQPEILAICWFTALTDILMKLNHFLFTFTQPNPDRNKTLFVWNQLTQIVPAFLPSDTTLLRDAYLVKFRTLNLKFSCCTTFDKISSLFWDWHASAMSSWAILKPSIFVNSILKKNQRSLTIRWISCAGYKAHSIKTSLLSLRYSRNTYWII